MTTHETPRRWRETGGPTALLEASAQHQHLGPTDEMLAAMLSQVQLAAAGGAATPSFDAGASAGAPSALPGAMGLGAKLGAAVLVVMAGVGVWLYCAEPAPRTAKSVEVTTATRTQPQALPSVAAPAVEVAKTVEASPLPARSVPKKRKTVESQPLQSAAPIPGIETGNLAGELALLRKARRALAHDPAQTLLFTAEHEAGFTKGSFVEEREMLAIEALVALDRRGDAEQRAKKYKKAFPASLHLRRLEVVLGPKAPRMAP